MGDGARAAERSLTARREALAGFLSRWTRFVPAIVWILWALHTLFLERRLADRKGTPVESLSAFLLEVVFSYAALFVYGWLVALLVPRNRVAATAISAAVAALYALMLLYHWHTRGQFEWGVLWRFRREMLDLEVRRTIGSFLGWRSYVFPAGAVVVVVLLETAGRVFSNLPRPRRRGLALLACVAAAAFIALGPVPTSDELTASLRAIQGNWRLTRMLPKGTGAERYPFARRSLVSGVGTAPATPPNVFFVVIESFNANFVETKTGDGREYTPFFNSLIPRGVYVENFYGNSMESPRGQLATLCSVLPAMRGTVFETYRGIRMRCLPEILDDHGYRTVFDEAARLLKFEDTGTFMEAIGFQVRRAALEPERERPADTVWGWGLQDDVFFREFFQFRDSDRASGGGS
ncbi:MAG TPA: sulfatase-like hydrolase/transferase, partial [Thermoanaerobaculia bacterium]|nr:sulfatase-like hydrolase/transferase [Thermoanaerobaculia bacterium]